MKFLPALAVLVVSVVAGAFASPMIFGGSGEEATKTPDAAAVQAEVRRIAAERAREQFAAWDESRSNQDDAGETLRAIFATHESTVDGIGERVGQLESGVEFAEALYDDPGGRAERDVAVMTGRLLDDDLKMGRIFMEAQDESMRRRAAGKFEAAIRKGSAEAAELLLLLWSDPAEGVSSNARRSTLNLARRAEDDAELAALLESSGLTGALAARTAEAEGRTKRSYLGALAALKHPAAEQGWIEIYNGAERDREKIEAARELKDLGRAGPFDDLLQRYGADMTSADERAARTAIDSLRRLGGEEARLVLKSALDADPEGENARRISRALRRLNEPERRNPRQRNGGGGDRGRRGGN